MESWVQSWRPRANAFCDFSSPCLWSIAPAKKIDAKSYKVLHLSRKIIFANLTIWCSKMQPLSGNQRPDLLTSLMNMSPVLRLPRKMHLSRSSSNVPRLPSFWEMLENFHVLLTLTRRAIPCARHAKQHLNVQKCFVPVGVLHFWLGNVLRATSAYTFWTSQLPKAVRRWCVLYILTWKCASRHNGVHFFKLPKHGLRMSCFDVFCAFWLGNVLHATMACTFSTSQLPKAVRRWCVLHILTSKVLGATTACNFSSLIWPAGSAPAALASLLFDPPEPQIIGKTQCFTTFLPFRAPGTSFFWDFLFLIVFLLLFSSLLFSSLLFFGSYHLCFSTYPYCRKFDF